MKHLKMNNIEYKAARHTLGLSLSAWLDRLGISLSAHKKYSSGHLPVSVPIDRHIQTLIKHETTPR